MVNYGQESPVCLLKLAEYEFQTQHNRRKSYVNAFVLSRNIASISAEKKKEERIPRITEKSFSHEKNKLTPTARR
jgi:hypothetical protein